MVVNEKLREIKIGITSVVAKKWIMNRKLGEGAFGIVFECYSVPNPSVKRALKAEIIGVDASHESLKMEIYVMRKMMSVNAAHSVQLFGAGTERNYNYVVMTLLGISLSDIRKRLPDEKFSLDSLIVIGIQSTDSLKELHSAGFVHRDIKPSNYTVGKEQTDWLYLIDFGICREIMYTEDLQTKLKCPRRNCQFRGTTRYCSINAHKRKELGRHDDLLSMMYMLFEGHAGSLPWKHKDRLMTEKLKSEKEEEMLSSAPKPFVKAYEYLRELTYFLTPDYKRIRNEFLMMAEERNLTPPYKLDWDAIVNSSVEHHPGAAPQPPGKMGKEQLMNPPDISTLYDVPDEFPHEESCSDSDRTIPSEQERHPQPSVYRTEEQTQTDETSQMQGGKGKNFAGPSSITASPYSEPSAPATPKLVDVPTLPKAEKKKEEKREEPRKERDEKKDERREEKKERKEEKREEHRKLKDDSTKKREIPKKDESGKVKVEKPETQAARTPLLATAPTPVATTPATAATAATVTAATTAGHGVAALAAAPTAGAAAHAAAAPATTKKLAKEAKEVHVEAFHPLKKTECSMRRKERSEMRKKRREARGAKTPAKKAVKTPSKGTKKIGGSAESAKKRDAPSRVKRHHTTMTSEDVKKDISKGTRKPNLSAETCADDDVLIPDAKEHNKKRRGATVSREDGSDTRMRRTGGDKETPKFVKDEQTQQLSCMQKLSPADAAARPALSMEPLSTIPQSPHAKSHPHTDHTLSSRRDTGKPPPKTKSTQRKTHGGSKEERTKEDTGAKKKGARSRASRAHNRNLSQKELTVEASEAKDKKEKKGVTGFISKMVRNPGSISKGNRKRAVAQGPPTSETTKTDKKSGRSSKKTQADEPPEKDVPTIPKTAQGGRSIGKVKKSKSKESK